MDQVGLASFADMEEHHDFLYALVMKSVPDTHHAISLQQVLQADRHMFAKATELCTTGLAVVAALGIVPAMYPMMAAILQSRNDPIIQSMLQPLPRGHGSAQSVVLHEKVKPGAKDHGPYGKGKGKGAGKGAGKGKGGKQSKGKPYSSLPAELEGMNATTKHGKKYCFAFNLANGCEYAKPGAWCKKGLHGCMKCGGPHAAIACPKPARG